jgi:hypothetical protein
MSLEGILGFALLAALDIGILNGAIEVHGIAVGVFEQSY